MPDSEETSNYLAIALADDAPGPCGLTLAVVQRAGQADADSVRVLDPEEGPMDIMDPEELNEEVEEGAVLLLERAVEIPAGSMALYLHRDFLQFYDGFFSPSGKPPGHNLPDPSGLPAGVLQGTGGRVLFGSKTVLQAYCQQAADILLYWMEQTLVHRYSRDPRGFPQQMEEAFRKGALLAATNLESRAYLDFHKRIAAAISLQPGEYHRGEWIFENMVQPHHPRLENFHTFFQEARGIRDDWKAQADILDREKPHEKLIGPIRTILADELPKALLMVDQSNRELRNQLAMAEERANKAEKSSPCVLVLDTHGKGLLQGGRLGGGRLRETRE